MPADRQSLAVHDDLGRRRPLDMLEVHQIRAVDAGTLSPGGLGKPRLDRLERLAARKLAAVDVHDGVLVPCLEESDAVQVDEALPLPVAKRHELVAAYDTVFTAALVILAVMIVLCLIRAILGPRVADRIVAVNMMGTLVMVVIAILALKQKEGYLADICMIYAMISFLAVIVLTKVFLGIYRERKQIGGKEHGNT